MKRALVWLSLTMGLAAPMFGAEALALAQPKAAATIGIPLRTEAVFLDLAPVAQDKSRLDIRLRVEPPVKAAPVVELSAFARSVPRTIQVSSQGQAPGVWGATLAPVEPYAPAFIRVTVVGAGGVAEAHDFDVVLRAAAKTGPSALHSANGRLTLGLAADGPLAAADVVIARVEQLSGPLPGGVVAVSEPYSVVSAKGAPTGLKAVVYIASAFSQAENAKRGLGVQWWNAASGAWELLLGGLDAGNRGAQGLAASLGTFVLSSRKEQ